MVILGEDFAALLGLALALIAVLMTMLTGNPMWDGLGSMWIGVILIVVAMGISREIMALLIGQSADPETVKAIRRFVEGSEGVGKVYRVLTLQLGTTLMVALKVKVTATSAAELVSRTNEIEAALRIEFPKSSGCSSSPTWPTEGVGCARRVGGGWLRGEGVRGFSGGGEVGE